MNIDGNEHADEKSQIDSTNGRSLRIRSLVATSLSHFANDGNSYVFITLYPILFPLAAYSLGTTKLTSLFIIGVLGALVNLSTTVASPLVGEAADKTRRFGFLLSLGLILLGIGIAGYALSTIGASGIVLFFLLVPFSIIGGIGGAFYHPLGGSVLSSTWPTKVIGRAMGINGAIGSTGRALYPLMVTALVAYFAIPSVTALAILSFAIAGFVSFTLSRTSPTKGERNDAAAKKKKEREANRVAIPLKVILPPILALTVMSFMRGIFAMGIMNFLPVYLEHAGGLSYSVGLGLALTVILILPILGQPLFGMVADRYGRRLSIAITTVGSSIAILVSLTTNNIFFIIAMFSLYAFFTFTQFPLQLPLATAAVPEGGGTLSNSIVWGIGNSGGGTVGPFLVGLLASLPIVGSLNGAFLIVTIISLLSVPLLFLVPKAPKTKL